ncbi:MAG: methyl-accepting chemotaxis protein [Bacillota bacterium]|nr:methyl-accepting chemotaxis protein [Bacillota bacterium]
MIKKIKNLKIPVRLLICFTIVGLIGTTGGILGRIIRNELISNLNGIYNETTLPLSYLTYIHGNFMELTANIASLESSPDQSISSDAKGITDNINNIQNYLAKFKEHGSSSDITKLNELLTKYTASAKLAVDLANSGRKSQISNMNLDMENMSKEINAEIYNLINQKVTMAEYLIKQNETTSLNNSNGMLAVVFAGVLAVILLGWLLSRSLLRPLYKMINCANKISEGEVDVDLDIDTKDELGILAESFKKIIISLKHLTSDTDMLVQSAINGQLSLRADVSNHKGEYRKIIDGINKTLDAATAPINEAKEILVEVSQGNLKDRLMGDYKGDHAVIKSSLNSTIESLSLYISEINNASEQLAISANRVSDGSQSLSQGSTEQASALEELTSAISHIANQTKENAGNATKANELVLSVQGNAEKGNDYMQEMLKSMQEIERASTNISKVIKVIDEIAFQTNILSLNAAIEAARAGQHGKGFAVVAEEVRTLAARSAQAAKETSSLVENSIEKVKRGMLIADDTAQALHEIHEGMSSTTSLVSDISLASNEQASAIVQINQGIEQLSLVVQSNSATAEEGAAASEELSSQAHLLRKMVDKFQLNEDAINNEGLEILNNINPKKAHQANLEKKSISDQEFGKY